MSTRFRENEAFERSLAARLMELRIEAKISQGAFADELGIDQATVSRVESTQRRLSTSEAFAWFQALGLDTNRTCKELENLWNSNGVRPPGFWRGSDNA